MGVQRDGDERHTDDRLRSGRIEPAGPSGRAVAAALQAAIRQWFEPWKCFWVIHPPSPRLRTRRRAVLPASRSGQSPPGRRRALWQRPGCGKHQRPSRDPQLRRKRTRPWPCLKHCVDNFASCPEPESLCGTDAECNALADAHVDVHTHSLPHGIRDCFADCLHDPNGRNGRPHTHGDALPGCRRGGGVHRWRSRLRGAVLRRGRERGRAVRHRRGPSGRRGLGRVGWGRRCGGVHRRLCCRPRAAVHRSAGPVGREPRPGAHAISVRIAVRCPARAPPLAVVGVIGSEPSGAGGDQRHGARPGADRLARGGGLAGVAVGRGRVVDAWRAPGVGDARDAGRDGAVRGLERVRGVGGCGQPGRGAVPAAVLAAVAACGERAVLRRIGARDAPVAGAVCGWSGVGVGCVCAGGVARAVGVGGAGDGAGRQARRGRAVVARAAERGGAAAGRRVGGEARERAGRDGIAVGVRPVACGRHD
mmetsp:Transcript_3614/g.15031  ORF Transcript_3614/g.15031 Transcript_3614/m.15031 type:complete len:477 (-) Transcript_3614:222-1652(-)